MWHLITCSCHYYRFWVLSSILSTLIHTLYTNRYLGAISTLVMHSSMLGITFNTWPYYQVHHGSFKPSLDITHKATTRKRAPCSPTTTEVMVMVLMMVTVLVLVVMLVLVLVMVIAVIVMLIVTMVMLMM